MTGTVGNAIRPPGFTSAPDPFADAANFAAIVRLSDALERFYPARTITSRGGAANTVAFGCSTEGPIR